MAHITTHTDHGANSVLAGVSRIFSAFGAFLVSISEANSKVRQAEALNALSDAELAKLGIKRDEIARHVFASSYWV